MKSAFGDFTKSGLIIIAIVLFTGCASSGDHRKPSSGVVSMRASDWDITYSSGMAPHPTQDATGGWHFDWTGTVHYVLVPFTPAKRPTVLEMTFRIVTSGGVQFHPTSVPQVLANFRPMIERAADDMTTEFGRFWSNQVFYVLATDNEIHTFTVPLTADHWTSVYGHSDQKHLDAMLANLGKVGFTFGGNFYGHGVSISGGTARFELLSFAVR